MTAAGFVAPRADVTGSPSPPFAEAASGTTYTFRETGINQTDIAAGNSLADFVVAFGRVSPATALQLAPTSQDWLKRAIVYFDLTFGNSRNSKSLPFFSGADELSSRLRLHELTVSATTPSPTEPFTRSVQKAIRAGSLDQAALPKQISDWLGISYETASCYYWREQI